jgi:acyl carrier protein
MPPLRGIFHLAAVLDDGILLQLNQERFETVMGPKAKGAWNLHRLTLDRPLDFFVLFSSVASVLSSPGQGNYVAANAFLDALAHHRRAAGLPGVAINWGLWAEVGVAARPEITNRLVQQGILPFSPAQGMQLLERILQLHSPQAMAISADWGKLLGLIQLPILASLAAEVDQKGGPAKAQRSKDGLNSEKLLAAASEDRQRLVEAFLVEQIARVLRCSPSKIDVHQPLTKLGIDSLMAVELKNRVELDLGLTVPVTALLQGPSLAQLSDRLIGQLPASGPAVAAPTNGASVAALDADALRNGGNPEQLLSKVDELSDEMVDSLLRDMVVGEVGEGHENAREMGK